MKTHEHIAKRLNSGFTLLELILIMSLIGMVSAGMIYNSVTPRLIHVDTALLKVVHDVRYAQDRAMVTGRNHGFRSITSTQYEIYDSSPGNPTTDPSTQQSMVVSLATSYPNVAFQATYQLEFNSLGSPVIGGGGSVQLGNGTESKTFSITNNTGLISMP